MSLKILKRGTVYLMPLVFLLSACEQKGTVKQYPLHYSGGTMGTVFTVKVSTLPDPLTHDELKYQIKSLLDRLNGQMSTYLPDSELSQFNNKQFTKWQTASASLYTVLEEAKRVSELSEGAFDITVAPLVNLWGFGSDPALFFKVPEDKLLEQQLTKIGYKHLLFEEHTKRIRKDIPELTLDLSAIAKGYAVDQVGLLLEKQGIVDYMVEIGGELKLRGTNIYNQPWRIAIEMPVARKQMIQKVLPVTDISMATSGDYRNFFEIDNVRFSHTIDPRSGRPIKHKLASVTVLSDTAMKADALATALMVLGPVQGYAWVETKNIAALFIIKTEDGFVEKISTALSDRLR